MRPSYGLILALILAFSHVRSAADVLVTAADNFSVDVSPVDGALAIDLLGNIWTLPGSGGQARQLTDSVLQASQPRWSPDGRQVLYQVRTPMGGQVWQVDLTTRESTRIINESYHVQDASWHPEEARILFASDRDGQDLDIWEMDLPTGLWWRLTNHDGDEVEPTWSADGQHLAYIRIVKEKYSLVIRQHGLPETEIVVSDTPLSSLNWRPDGSLLTFLRDDGERWVLQMAILSRPVLVRTLSDNENIIPSPVRWPSRMRMIYAADGRIVTRHFGDRRSRPIHFRASVNDPPPLQPQIVAKREIEVVDAPSGRLVIRGERLFDGIWSDYREQFDVLVENGKITAVEPRQDWDAATVLDLGDITMMPGLIDSWADLPNSLTAADGASLLAYGVTTLVSPDDAGSQFDFSEWDSENTPGPRVLPGREFSADVDVDPPGVEFLVRIQTDPAAVTDVSDIVSRWHAMGIPVMVDNRSTARGSGADLVLGAQSISRGQLSPGQQTLPSAQLPILLSALADAGTPGISLLIDSRQARALGHTKPASRRISNSTGLAGSQQQFIAASRPNRFPPGLALHAELQALRSAGLNGEQVMHAAGRNAAKMLGLENQIGTITPGAAADLLLISGDPLAETTDTIKIIAVVRNGRFFSLASLLERIGQAKLTGNVE